jgi:hypothetical protein
MEFFQGNNRLGYFRLLIGNTAVFITKVCVNVDESSMRSLRKRCFHPSLTAAQHL